MTCAIAKVVHQQVMYFPYIKIEISCTQYIYIYIYNTPLLGVWAVPNNVFINAQELPFQPGLALPLVIAVADRLLCDHPIELSHLLS